MNCRRIAALALVAASAALGVGAQGAGAAGAGDRTITVSGTGIVTTVPNQAGFSFGVSTTGTTAQQALSSNAVRMNRVIDALKRLGIRPADLQTSEVSLSPNTNSNQSPGAIILPVILHIERDLQQDQRELQQVESTLSPPTTSPPSSPTDTTDNTDSP